jgi:predicted GIY-YIG superfamily endonuclease
MNNSGEGWIYLMESENGLYKIGSTANPDHRLMKLNAQSPVAVKYIHYFRSEHMTTSEKWLHNKYKDCRHHGEWFNLSNEQVQEIASMQDYSADKELANHWQMLIEQAVGKRVKKLYEVKP